MAKTYAEKLKHPRWQQKRLSVFDRDGWECTGCGAKDKTLHAHHLTYRKGLDPWEYDLDDLDTLCEDCHKEYHECKSYIAVITDFEELKAHRSLMVAHFTEQDIDEFIMVSDICRAEYSGLIKLSRIRLNQIFTEDKK